MHLNQWLLIVLAVPMLALAPLVLAPAGLWRTIGMPLAAEGIERVAMRHWALLVAALGVLLLVAALSRAGGPLLRLVLALVAIEKVALVLLMLRHREVDAGTRRLIFVNDGVGALLAAWLMTRL